MTRLPARFLSLAKSGTRDFLFILTATLPIYALAVWSFGSAYLAMAGSDEMGWMIMFFPILALPPVVPWLSVALPMAAALSIRRFPLNLFAVCGAAAIAYLAEGNLFADPNATQGRTGTLVGGIDPVLFILGIWALAGLARWLIHVRTGKGPQ